MVEISTAVPKRLLDAIYKAIDDGHIQTWTYDKDGDFIHCTPDSQWVGNAWLHPQIGVGLLTLIILPPAQEALLKSAYAVYHGRFIEMLLEHFDEDFTVSTATALQTVEELAIA
jgi:hypothetical protein